MISPFAKFLSIGVIILMGVASRATASDVSDALNLASEQRM